jgi:hypothetical protein
MTTQAKVLLVLILESEEDADEVQTMIDESGMAAIATAGRFTTRSFLPYLGEMLVDQLQQALDYENDED